MGGGEGQVDTDGWELILSTGSFTLLFNAWDYLKPRLTKDCWPETILLVKSVISLLDSRREGIDPTPQWGHCQRFIGNF